MQEACIREEGAGAAQLPCPARVLSRKDAAAELGISRQRVEQLLDRWPQVERDAGVDIEALRRLRAAERQKGVAQGAGLRLRSAGIQRRGLDPEEAAAYVGLSQGAFLAEVAAGGMPQPIQLRASEERVWDRLALDRAIEASGGLLQPTVPTHWPSGPR